MSGSLTIEETILIVIVIVYFFYYLLAKDEMKGKPRLKRLIWLVLIPSCFPTTFLVLWVLMDYSFLAVFPAFVISIMAIVPLVVLSELVGESSHTSSRARVEVSSSGRAENRCVRSRLRVFPCKRLL
jgi:hypothetical protein